MKRVSFLLTHFYCPTSIFSQRQVAWISGCAYFYYIVLIMELEGKQICTLPILCKYDKIGLESKI